MPGWDDTDYAPLAGAYSQVRQADPEVAAQLHAALGEARTVIDVGAGTGSYEPADRHVVAVEPSADMRARRPRSLAPAIDAQAEELPFDDDTFDAALAVLTIHHWPDLAGGLRELRRVASGPVVVLTADPDLLDRLWLTRYSPEFHAAERRRYPAIDRVAEHLGGDIVLRPLSIPLGCADGFADAFYGRPESLLDGDVRRAQSAWSFVPAEAQSAFEDRLRADLESGAWDDQYGHLRSQPYFEGSLRVLVAR